MPFEEFRPRSFTAVSVLANAPVASGIYAVSKAREWIDKRERLARHNRLPGVRAGV